MPLSVSDEADRAAWLRLARTQGIGPRLAQRLILRFGSPQALFEAGRDALAETVGQAAASALLSPRSGRERAVEQSLEWARAAPDHHLVAVGDPDYPGDLAPLDDAPIVLHVVGVRAALRRPMLGIVGSRNPSTAGQADAEDFAASASQAGLTVASGLALGIDAAAHRGALRGPSGTIAVLATGPDVIYPVCHRGLAEKIAETGALLSEQPPGTRPVPGLFPRRNRLIAGLAKGVLVVEAALRSGSLITARLGAEYGREVFAIPGSIHSPLARGCHALIREGAALVESIDEVLEAIGRIPGVRRPHRAGAARAHHGSKPDVVPEDPLLQAIGYHPVLPDTLCARLSLAAGELAARLVMLEIEGRIERLADGRVICRPAAA